MGNWSDESNSPDESEESQFAGSLRAAAEKHLAGMAPAEMPSRPVEEIYRELRICQIELGMQAEELLRAQLMMKELRDRYTNFFDLAPVGCLTLGSEAMIDELNLTGAALLGGERNNLLHKRFADFVAPEDIGHWNQYFAACCSGMTSRPVNWPFCSKITRAARSGWTACACRRMANRQQCAWC